MSEKTDIYDKKTTKETYILSSYVHTESHDIFVKTDQYTRKETDKYEKRPVNTKRDR